ncbi:MAG: PEP-CTERM sorting domain-containing protein [Ferribacterium limneticum]
MKFSLKTLAAAVVMAAAASSSFAAIDSGAGGNGELFFSAWDGSSSYNYDMNMTIDAFEAAKNADGYLNLVWGSDFSSSFASWASTATAATLSWNIMATDAVGARRILSTVSNVNVLPATNKDGATLRTAAGNVRDYATAVNGIIVGDSAVTEGTSAASYAGKMGAKVYDKFNFDTTGNLAANDYDNGVVFQKTAVNSTGTAAGINAAYVDETVAVRAWVGSDNTLHIAAMPVPEPESYAMLLAGLGMIGFVARRRNERA